MSKSSNEKKSKLIKSAIIIGAITAVSLPPILIASLDNLSPTEIKRIVEEINSWNIKVNDQILTLDNNQHSVDTLEKSIEDAEKVLFDAEKAINSLDKEEYKKYSKIQNALSDTKANLAILKDKKDASKSVLENNRKKLDVIVKEATETSKKAIELAENTLEIDLEGLKAANKELEAALNEVNEAKEKAKDSAKHIDNLILLANKVKVAEDKVAKFIKEIQKLSKKQLNDKFNKEVQKHIDALKQKNNEFNPNDLDLDSISAFSKSLEDEITKGKRVYEFINKQNVDDNTKAKNEELNKVIADSENISKKLEEKALEIKSDIDSKIEALKNIINQASSNIDSHNDFDALKKEFEASNERIDGEILNLANKAQEVKYHDAKNIIEESKTKDIENKTKALNKMKALVLGILDESSNLKPEQISKFKNEIENATLPEQLEAIRNDIQLTNKKEKAKDNLNSGYGLLTPEYKENLNNLIDKAESEQQINDILTQAKELVDKKKTAQNSIDNDFEHLSDNQKQNYKNEISSADSKDKVDEILADAKTLNDEKKEKIENIEKLEKLTEEDKNRFKEEIKNSGTSSEDEQQENTPSKVLEKAIELNDSKKDALDKLEKLENITNKDSIKEQINNATTKEEVQRIILDAEALNKDKSDAKEAINKLDNLSQNEKQEYINQINNASESTNFETIKQEATNKNQEKDQLINEIDSLDFANNSKAQFKQNIKNKSLDEAKAYLEELKTLNENKNEIKQLIEDSQNNIPEDVKNRLKESLTNAATKDEIDNVKKDVELEIEKQKAIDEIKKISPENKQTEWIGKINNARSKKEIESLLLSAQGRALEAAKLKAESDIELLDFISKETKSKTIEKIKTLQDESQIKNESDRLINKNQEKKDLFEQNIKESDLFTPEYIQEIKQKIINEDEESKYQEIKNTFVALKEAKKQFNEKLKNNTLFDSLGTKDKENLGKKLKNIKDIAQVQELEKEADELNKFKKDLIEKTGQIQNVDQDEIDRTKNQIKEAQTKEEANKLYEDLALKSKRKTAKEDIEKLNNLSQQVAQKHFNDLIDKAEINNIDAIVDEAKRVDKINENNIDELKKLPLLNEAYITEKENNIKNNFANNNESSFLNQAKELSNKKTSAQSSIKREYTSLSEDQHKLIDELLKNANNDESINNIKKEAELWNIQKEAQTYLNDQNSIYLNENEKNQGLTEIQNAKQPDDARTKFNELKRKNESKKTYYNDLESFKSSFDNSVIQNKKSEIKNSSENDAKKIHDELKKLDTNLKSSKEQAKNKINMNFNSKPIDASRIKFYKDLITELKYNENLISKNNKEELMNQKIQKILEVAKDETILSNNTDSNSLLNPSEKDDLNKKLNKLKKKKNQNKEQTLNKIQAVLKEAKQLQKEKENIQNQINQLTLVKSDLRNQAKNNIKNQTKKQAQNKLNELKRLNDEIDKAIKKLDSKEFEKLSSQSKNKYKEQIKNVNNVAEIQPIIDRATNEVQLQLARENAQRINNFNYLSREEKNLYNDKTSKSSDPVEINRLVAEAENKNHQKNNWINDIHKFDLLTHEWRNNSETFIKVNSTDMAQARYNKLKEAQNLKKEREAIINSLSNELPNWVKSQLLDNLKSKDFKITNNSKNYDDFDRNHLNSMTNEINEWSQSGPIHVRYLNTSNEIKNIMNEFNTNGNNINMQNHQRQFQSFINDNSLAKGDNKDRLINKKNTLQRDIITHFDNFIQDTIGFFEDFKTKAMHNNVITNKSNLNKLKTELNNYSQKLDNIKNKTNSINQIQDLSKYNQAKEKVREVENWFNQKIELVDKHEQLKQKVLISEYLNEKDKEIFENKIYSERHKKDHLNNEFRQLEASIDSKINQNKQTVNKYSDAIYDIERTINDLREFEEIRSNTNLYAAHQSIVQKYDKLISGFKNDKDQYFNKNELDILTEKIVKAKDSINEYIDPFNETKKYINDYSANKNIKDAAWNRYYDYIVQQTKNNQNNNLLTNLANNGINDDSIYVNQIKNVMPNVFLEVKINVFKNEILRIIGNGNWSRRQIWTYSNDCPAWISNAYIINENNKQNASIILDDNHYRKMYANMKIEFTPDTIESKRDGYTFWSHGIKFYSGDNDNIVYELYLSPSQANKNHDTIWFEIRNLPTESQYRNNSSPKPEATKPSREQNLWFNERNIRFKSATGKNT
ncbi:GA module-containing protein [Mycoplasma tauri]|uniref:GA module-containing protein n=1 Tax=Mycoplasma tauri TaxID=547987 RepID=UPI001CC0429F|nr:GA module-containing protein [Mycoplasma tauri]MBZ4204513.1 GA module-containing protein [Mycoplasma tauri]